MVVDANLIFSILSVLYNIISNPVVVFLGIVISIIQIIISLRSEAKKQLCYAVKNNNVINESANKINNLKVIYNNKLISTLSISDILFYSKSGKLINYNEIRTLTPLSIKVEDGEILRSTVEFCKKKENDIEIDNQGDIATITFDYLNKYDGAIFRIYHTGLDSDDVKLTGELKDTKIIRKMAPAFIGPRLLFPKLYLKGVNIFSAIMMGFSAAFFALLIILIILSTIVHASLDFSQYGVPIVAYLIMLILGILLYRFSNVETPKGFEKFWEDF